MVARFMQKINVFQPVLQALVPSCCPACMVTLTAPQAALCPACWHALPRWDKTRYPAPPLPEAVDSFHAPYMYEEPVSTLVRRLKFNDMPELALVLGKLMAQCPKPEGADMVLAVPMHKGRLWRRQFNQSQLIAREIATAWQLDAPWHVLQRVRATRTQRGMRASARRRNLKNAFYADADMVKGKRIVLVDDVWTTGSTAQECAHALKKAGALQVDMLAVCYVVPGGAENLKIKG